AWTARPRRSAPGSATWPSRPLDAVASASRGSTDACAPSAPGSSQQEGGDNVHFLQDRSGASIAEAIAYTLIALAAAGAAVWAVYNAVAGRFNDIANSL